MFRIWSYLPGIRPRSGLICRARRAPKNKGQKKNRLSAAESLEKAIPVDDRADIAVVVYWNLEQAGMSYYIEVTTDYSQRFYERSSENLSLTDIFLSHSKARSLHIVVNNYEDKSKGIQPVNLSSFRCLKELEYLTIEMNNVATIVCDNAFFFALKHLSLSKCQMTHYDLCILMNCVGDSLESIELQQVALMDSQCSKNVSTMLSELSRLSNLRSLKLDKTWAEFEKDSRSLSCPRLFSLSLLNIKFEDLFSPEVRKLTQSLVCSSIEVDGVTYRITDLPELLGKFHQFAARNWSSYKFGSWSRLTRRYQPRFDAKTSFNFVLGCPKIEPGETIDDAVGNLKEVFAFDSLKVYVPQCFVAMAPFTPVYSPRESPQLSPVSSVPSDEEEDTFVTAFDSLSGIAAS